MIDTYCVSGSFVIYKISVLGRKRKKLSTFDFIIYEHIHHKDTHLINQNNSISFISYIQHWWICVTVILQSLTEKMGNYLHHDSFQFTTNIQ